MGNQSWGWSSVLIRIYLIGGVIGSDVNNKKSYNNILLFKIDV